MDSDWADRFEKSLYDLIRGLRHHKGNEREYIHNSLRECRAEIRGSDIDLKATALLKLIYLEMFGHDMSWASFNVLEVMSSPKYLQKRVGYLGAVQSFRPDTEVLMLATNLLKKDINSAAIPTIYLPLITLPHVITTSLALSLQSDLMPRLSHSSPSIRKKTIVTIYRLTLVYPETLRHAWPKIKDMLMDEHEDPSVTAAVINVVCELGWRRPQDFLPLAPRFFSLLVDGGNNWMAIKIIKLFATLTPLEPRLIRKLLPPLTILIRTTPAMSLLYECIHGIIQGGILDGDEIFREREEVAELCVTKLQGMIATERDPNLKYVALVAFKNIVKSHPHLVSTHQDVILDCIEDPDISIRLQALELGCCMVNADNIVLIVDRLMRQLYEEPLSDKETNTEGKSAPTIEPAADSEGEDPEEKLRLDKPHKEDVSSLPGEYRTTVIRQILEICSRNTYANIPNFDWYITTLLELIGLVPPECRGLAVARKTSNFAPEEDDVAILIGIELRNVSVRVASARFRAVRAAASLLAPDELQPHLPSAGPRGQGVLAYCAWIVGEYADKLPDKFDTLGSLQLTAVQDMSPDILCAYVQAIPKVLASIINPETFGWSPPQQARITLLLARIVHFLEPLAAHASLEVQERSVEFLEFFRLAMEAVTGHNSHISTPPSLITCAMPALFSDSELGPVALSAQRKIPLPQDLDLSEALNEALLKVLLDVDEDQHFDADQAEARAFYLDRPLGSVESHAAADRSAYVTPTSSYQNMDNTLIDPAVSALRLADRRQRQKGDPFYIPGGYGEFADGAPSLLHDVKIRETNPEDIDIESIPIMELELEKRALGADLPENRHRNHMDQQKKKVHVALEENFDEDTIVDYNSSGIGGKPRKSYRSRTKKALLQVESGDLSSISLALQGNNKEIGPGDVQRENAEAEDAEMAKELAKVERLRMQMQRASEKISRAEGVPEDGTLIMKKRRKKKDKANLRLDVASGSAPAPGNSFVQDPAMILRMKRLRKSSQVLEPAPTSNLTNIN